MGHRAEPPRWRMEREQLLQEMLPGESTAGLELDVDRLTHFAAHDPKLEQAED